MENKKWELTYNLLTNDSIKKDIEEQHNEQTST